MEEEEVKPEGAEVEDTEETGEVAPKAADEETEA